MLATSSLDLVRARPGLHPGDLTLAPQRNGVAAQRARLGRRTSRLDADDMGCSDKEGSMGEATPITHGLWVTRRMDGGSMCWHAGHTWSIAKGTKFIDISLALACMLAEAY